MVVHTKEYMTLVGGFVFWKEKPPFSDIHREGWAVYVVYYTQAGLVPRQFLLSRSFFQEGSRTIHCTMKGSEWGGGGGGDS